MKNPNWHRDEIILALDLYFDPRRGPIDKSNPKVIKLSGLLSKLPIFLERPDEEKFRNPNGVSLKLSNFLAIDPTHRGEGMKSYSKLDKEIFYEFFHNRAKLKKLAKAIKDIAQNEPLRKKLSRIEDDEVADEDSVYEGQVLYKLHKLRERNRKIANQKKKKVLKATGKLECEVCEFDFHKRYGKLGAGFIECHHTKPLSYNLGQVETKLSDLALVCSNCHRMLHRSISVMNLNDLKRVIKG